MPRCRSCQTNFRGEDLVCEQCIAKLKSNSSTKLNAKIVSKNNSLRTKIERKEAKERAKREREQALAAKAKKEEEIAAKKRATERAAKIAEKKAESERLSQLRAKEKQRKLALLEKERKEREKIEAEKKAEQERIRKEELRLEKLNLVSIIESVYPNESPASKEYLKAIKKWKIEDLRYLSKCVTFFEPMENLVTKMIDDKKRIHKLDKNGRPYFSKTLNKAARDISSRGVVNSWDDAESLFEQIPLLFDNKNHPDATISKDNKFVKRFETYMMINHGIIIEDMQGTYSYMNREVVNFTIKVSAISFQ